MKFDTQTVHFQQEISASVRSKASPVYQTSAFVFKDLEEMEAAFQKTDHFYYTRVNNPNTQDLGQGVARLEGAPKGVATSSGLSAILAGVLSVAKGGDHIVASEDVYGGTYTLLSRELTAFGIDVSFVPFADLEQVKRAIRSNTVLLYSESITNPLLRVEQIEHIVQLAQSHQLKTMIDNTFATPYFIRPYEMGVDLVVHSATKFIGGHSDVTAGVLVGNEDVMASAKEKVVNFGSSLSPFEAWLACRGLKTLSVRMERQAKNAATLAEHLKRHPSVKRVYYPKGVSAKGNGAIVSMELADACDVASFFKSLSWIKIVPTLAGVDTSVSYPAGTSHRTLSADMRDRLGITSNLVRISVGIEDAEDIISAFDNALDAASAAES